jgi:hypothetical protein
VALAILAWVAAPQSAQASCGDYVVMGSGHAPSPEGPISFPAVPLGSFTVPTLPPCACPPPMPFDNPPPCPGCSAPSPTESTAVPITVRVSHDGATRIDEIDDPPSATRRSRFAQASLILAEHLSGIYRPPRPR